MVHNISSLNAIVTGGASGLGAVISRRLGEHGVNVCINGLPSDQPAAEVICKEISEKSNVKCTFIVADISNPQACDAVVAHAVKELGGLDIVIANAGWTRHAAWSDLDAFPEEDWLKSFRINTLSVMWLFKAATPIFKKTFEDTGRAGVVITTNSIAGTGPTGSSLPYSVTKAAQLRMVEGLARDNGPWARVNAVCPGLIITPFSQAYGEERMKALKQESPLKKEANLEDCAEVFMMLCQNDSITGKRITVDCGLSKVS
ncbi:hypothetical protein AJ79_00573 [Helicocarpus griseus UAMH5409]|uniref:Uncharacterized protein n=1 Tax=Helicocarpus griseus UAMH5409 TaxID=1447875 RepID=A0A2B7Y2C9_9EURO|nr:hypothetical protein AJ79_00573 [Helicocarpus griseus UAMH5409]